MNKVYGSLITTIICSTAHGLVASEKPFFDRKTQDVFKKTAKNYAIDCGSMAVGVLGIALAAEHLRRKNQVVGSLNCVHRNVFKKTAKSLFITVPIVFGGELAYHKYQENFREKNRA